VIADRDTRLADWLRANAGLHDARIGEKLAGGNANVTRLVTAREGRFVLRHPPTNTVSGQGRGGDFARVRGDLGACGTGPGAAADCLL
jgi:hypothetical protein